MGVGFLISIKFNLATTAAEATSSATTAGTASAARAESDLHAATPAHSAAASATTASSPTAPAKITLESGITAASKSTTAHRRIINRAHSGVTVRSHRRRTGRGARHSATKTTHADTQIHRKKRVTWTWEKRYRQQGNHQESIKRVHRNHPLPPRRLHSFTHHREANVRRLTASGAFRARCMPQVDGVNSSRCQGVVTKSARRVSRIYLVLHSGFLRSWAVH